MQFPSGHVHVCNHACSVEFFSCLDKRSAWCGCIPAFDPVSKNRCSPAWRKRLIISEVYLS